MSGSDKVLTNWQLAERVASEHGRLSCFALCGLRLCGLLLGTVLCDGPLGAGADIALFESTKRITREGHQGRALIVVPLYEINACSWHISLILKPHAQKSPVAYNANGVSLCTSR